MVNATDFGVPQRRRRLIMLAMRGLKSKLPDTLVSEEPLAPVTVSDAFLFLSKIGALPIRWMLGALSAGWRLKEFKRYPKVAIGLICLSICNSRAI